jgi:hypothetical protein
MWETIFFVLTDDQRIQRLAGIKVEICNDDIRFGIVDYVMTENGRFLHPGLLTELNFQTREDNC